MTGGRQASRRRTFLVTGSVYLVGELLASAVRARAVRGVRTVNDEASVLTMVGAVG